MAWSHLYDHVITVKALSSATRTDGTVYGDGVDRAPTSPKPNEFETVLFVVLTATLTDGVHTITIEESDDDSTYADAPAAAILGTEPVTAATNDDTVFEFGYKGLKRYCRLKVVTTGTTSGGTLGAVAVLGTARESFTRT